LNDKYWDSYFTNKDIPQGSEWLKSFPDEQKGQSFARWAQHPLTRFPKSNNKDNTIGIACIGNFDLSFTINNRQVPLLTILTEYTEAFFQLPLKVLPSLPSKNITSRMNGCHKQLHAEAIHDILYPIKTKDKSLFCVMAVTMIDLYPCDSWNFVFGEADQRHSVGVFSFARYFENFYNIDDKSLKNRKDIKLLNNIISDLNDNNNNNNNDDKNEDILFPNDTKYVFIRRCLNVLIHEIGHLFGLGHCPFFECLMNGSNSLEESDQQPLYFCPICDHKLYFSRIAYQHKKYGHQLSKFILSERYKKLALFCKKYNLINDYKWFYSRYQFIKQFRNK